MESISITTGTNAKTGAFSYAGRLYAEEVLARGWAANLKGERLRIHSNITAGEARVLAGLVLAAQARQCLETGVAMGISALAITQALAETGGSHIGIDPFQTRDYGGAALAGLAEYKLQDRFSLREGPSHSEMPNLLNAGSVFDLIFIDGAHQFSHKFIDFFYAHLLLKMGGYLVIHDLLFPATKKLYRLVQTLNQYEFVATPFLRPSLAKKLRFLAGAFAKGKPLRTYWPNGFGNLLVLRKVSDKVAPWNVFHNF